MNTIEVAEVRVWDYAVGPKDIRRRMFERIEVWLGGLMGLFVLVVVVGLVL